MLEDTRETLFILKGQRGYYKSSIENYEKNIEEAAEKIAEAKAALNKVLEDRETAPAELKEVERRIIILEAEAKKQNMTIPIASNLKKLIIMRKKLADLEAKFIKDG